MFVREIPRVFELAGLNIENTSLDPKFIEKAQGWTEETDPQMVDYDKLPEGSKALNRNTAKTIANLVHKHILASKKVQEAPKISDPELHEVLDFIDGSSKVEKKKEEKNIKKESLKLER